MYFGEETEEIDVTKVENLKEVEKEIFVKRKSEGYLRN
jgi:hypothetical protein